MSAYRHSMSAVQRAKKRSATGAAAYRSGAKLVDVRTGAEYDYSRRRGVAATHLVVPGAAIDAVDRQTLWAAVERKHTRGDAVPAREIVVALPCQLDPIDRAALALQYARELADRYGVAVDLAVHLPSIKPGHDQRNHHAHLLMSACSVQADATGSVVTCGKKVEALDPIAGRRRGGEPIAEVERARWAAMCNAALEAAGSDVVYDHRSYERQGIDQIPQIHLGPAAHDQLLRIQTGAEHVVPLDRTRRHLELEAAREHLRTAQHWEAEAARLQAEVIVMPAPELRPDEPVEGPSAVVVPIRPAPAEPPPAPDTPTVLAGVARLWASLARLDGLHDERRDTWPILRAMDRQGWTPDAPALRALLDAHPALRREWHDELTARAPAINAAATERTVERIAARSAERREAAKSYLVSVPSPAPARAPAATEAAPVARRDLATVPAPLPAARTVRDVDEAIADAEARLQALEQRERVRAAAAEAYRRAQAALRAAQAGLWSRVRAFVGLGASPAEQSARDALKAAEQALKSQGGAAVFGKAVVAVDAGERIALKKQLVALCDERGGLVAADAETARRALAAVDQVIDLVRRAERVVPAEQRPDWPALRALDAAGSVQQLRERLVVDPGLAIALAHDLGQRVSEIEALEDLSRTDSGLPGRPEFVRVSRAESVVDRPQGLLAAIESGPRRAPPGHFIAYFDGCEKRGQISSEERDQVAEILNHLPAGPLLRDELLRLVDQMQQQDEAPGQDDWPAPGA